MAMLRSMMSEPEEPLTQEGVRAAMEASHPSGVNCSPRARRCWASASVRAEAVRAEIVIMSVSYGTTTLHPSSRGPVRSRAPLAGGDRRPATGRTTPDCNSITVLSLKLSAPLFIHRNS